MRTRLFLPLLAAALTGGVAHADQQWTRHVSPSGFSVDRPQSWETVGAPPDRLVIASGHCRREAGGLCEGEAQIVVRWEPGGGKPARAKACWDLAETLSETDVGPGRRTQNRLLSCTIGARRFLISERHWKGDKNTAGYGRVAMRMVKSLRYPS